MGRRDGRRRRSEDRSRSRRRRREARDRRYKQPKHEMQRFARGQSALRGRQNRGVVLVAAPPKPKPPSESPARKHAKQTKQVAAKQLPKQVSKQVPKQIANQVANQVANTQVNHVKQPAKRAPSPVPKQIKQSDPAKKPRAESSLLRSMRRDAQSRDGLVSLAGRMQKLGQDIERLASQLSDIQGDQDQALALEHERLMRELGELQLQSEAAQEVRHAADETEQTLEASLLVVCDNLERGANDKLGEMLGRALKCGRKLAKERTMELAEACQPLLAVLGADRPPASLREAKDMAASALREVRTAALREVEHACIAEEAAAMPPGLVQVFRTQTAGLLSEAVAKLEAAARQRPEAALDLARRLRAARRELEPPEFPEALLEPGLLALQADGQPEDAITAAMQAAVARAVASAARDCSGAFVPDACYARALRLVRDLSEAAFAG